MDHEQLGGIGCSRDNRRTGRIGTGPGVVVLNLDPTAVTVAIADRNGDLDRILEMLPGLFLVDTLSCIVPYFVVELKFFHFIAGF